MSQKYKKCKDNHTGDHCIECNGSYFHVGYATIIKVDAAQNFLKKPECLVTGYTQFDEHSSRESRVYCTSECLPDSGKFCI